MGINVGSGTNATKTDPKWALNAIALFTPSPMLYSLQPRMYRSLPFITRTFKRSRAENQLNAFRIHPFAFRQGCLTTPGSAALPRRDPPEKVCRPSTTSDLHATYAVWAYF